MHKDEVVLVQAVTALTVGCDLANRMQRGELWGTVHSVFRRAFNFIDQNGELYTVTSASLGPAPNSAMVEDRRGVWTDAVKTGIPVVACGSDWLLVGDGSLGVSLRGARVWRVWQASRPALSPSEVMANLRLAGSLVAGRRDAELALLYPALATPAKPATIHGLPALAGWVLDAARDLAAAWRAEAPDGIRAAGARLAGLGPGLTPSGDDFLAGFMAAAATVARSHPVLERSVRQANRHITEAAVHGTNPISCAQLSYAARGQPPAVVQRCITALLYGSQRQAAKGVRRLLEVGATSGVDWLVGIGFGCSLVMESLSQPAGCEKTFS